MLKGRDRNVPCWCESGKKFKHCHLGRESLPRVTQQEMVALNAAFHQERVCLHPDAGEDSCAGAIVKAHTVQKSILRQIATGGHVHQLLPPLDDLIRNRRPRPAKVGINQASTFTGFCTRHDNELFAPIEKTPVAYCREHAFLLTYRALCQELYKKRARAHQERVKRDWDRGLHPLDQMAWQRECRQRSFYIDLAVRDFEHHKRLYDACFRAGDFEGVSAVFIELSGPVEWMCSGVILPEIDFNGKALQRLGDSRRILDFFSFSLIARENTPFAVFAWLGQSKCCHAFVESLLELGERMPAAMARFAIGSFENMFIRPEWFRALDENQSEWVARSMMKLVQEDEEVPDFWKDDGVDVIGWTVSKIIDLRL